MRQVKLNNLRSPLYERIEAVLRCTGFDIIKVLWVDIVNQYVRETESVNRINYEYAADAFEYYSLEGIIHLLKTAKEAFVLEESEAEYKGVTCKKAGNELAQEIYIPFFNYQEELAGFIYLAKKEQPAEDILSRQDCLDAILPLISAAEMNKTRYMANKRLYDSVLFICELANINQPFLVGNLFTTAYWATGIAKNLKLSDKEISKLQLASMMHDLGNIYFNESLPFIKPELSAEEAEKVKTRLNYSYELSVKVCQIFELPDIPSIILNCQEKVDGKGYPRGAKGEEIPLLSKIISLAKYITYLLSYNSASKKVSTYSDIIRSLKRNAKTWFDPKVVKAAIASLLYEKEEYSSYFSGIGSYGTLSLATTDKSNNDVNIWGNVRQSKFEYEFTPVGTIPKVDIYQIRKASLYLNINEKFIRYNLNIVKVLPSSFLFTNLERVNEEGTFSIKWSIEAQLITKTKKLYNIFINLIGGEYLDFYIYSTELAEPIGDGIVRIVFDKGDEILLPGIIILRQEINEKCFFRFKYTNLSEANESHLFAGMFRKQAELRRMALESGELD